MSSAWATVADVLEIARRNVDEEDIAVAMSTIDIYSNRTIAASGSMGARDRYWLRVATAWQACREAAIPRDDARHAYDQLSQDGVSVKHRDRKSVV